MIVAPLGLIRQWHNQLKVFFRRNAIDIYVYPSASKAQMDFWSPTSAWGTSAARLCHRLVLVAESVSTQDSLCLIMSNTFLQTFTTHSGAVLLHPKSRKVGTNVPPTLRSSGLAGVSVLNREWGCIVIDEAHSLRSNNRSYRTALFLRTRARLMIGLTATPLWTSPQVECFYYAHYTC